MAEIDDTTVSTPDDGTGDQPAVTEPVTEPTETPIEPEPLQEPTAEQLASEERLLNKFQSWQGRREKDFKDEIFGGMANLLNQQQPQPQPDFSGMNDDPEPDPDVDVKSWIRWDQRQQQQQFTTVQQTNERTYQSVLNSPQIRHQDEEVHNAAMNEIKNDQNLDPYGQPIGPAADAVLNYNNAIRSVLEKRLFPTDDSARKATNPLQNNHPPQPGLGVSQPGSAGGSSNVSMPKNLSPESKSWIAHAGWNAEKVKKVIASED